MPSPFAAAPEQVIIDWIAALGWNCAQETGYPLFPGPEILISPDRAVFVTGNAGPGFVTEEGSADGWGFQTLLRGPDDDPLEPQLRAQQLDAMIYDAPGGQNVDGVTVQSVHRQGGPPAALPLSPEDRRFAWTCSYIAVLGA